jgi:hypothetical protein
MKTSARNATLFISFLFLFFNGVQVYLILQRIAGTKAKFNTVCTNALLSTLFEYNKLKGTDTASKPKQALITWSLDDIAVNRLDSQNIAVRSPLSRLYAMRPDPASIEALVSRPRSVSPDLALLGSLYERVLDSFKVHSKYRLDTFPIPFGTGNSRIILPERVNNAWAMKRTKTYPFSTNPQRIFFYPTL